MTFPFFKAEYLLRIARNDMYLKETALKSFKHVIFFLISGQPFERKPFTPGIQATTYPSLSGRWLQQPRLSIYYQQHILNKYKTNIFS